jgi:hypothetical protein
MIIHQKKQRCLVNTTKVIAKERKLKLNNLHKKSGCVKNVNQPSLTVKNGNLEYFFYVLLLLLSLAKVDRKSIIPIFDLKFNFNLTQVKI